MATQTAARHAGDLDALARQSWLVAVGCVTVLVSAVFWLFPIIDIAAARFFYAPAGGFIGERSPALVGILRAGRAAGWVVGVAMLVVLAIKLWRPDLLTPRIWRRWWVTLIAVLLGPGLLVNGLLKAYVGRPRPLQTTEFGGTADFVPVWTYSKQCAANCSFVSGEASFGLFLVVFAFWFSGPARWLAFGAVGLFGLAMSVNRMAFGAHYLSDVLLAWCLTAMVILLVDRYLPARLVAM